MSGTEVIGAIESKRAGTSGPGGIPVRLAVNAATGSELPAGVDVISAAFLHDPTWSWAFPDPAVRRRWWMFCISEALRYPWTFKTTGYEVASVWIPAGGTEMSHEAEGAVPEFLQTLVGARAGEVAELLNRFEAAHPRPEPHYYLSLLGTAPDQGGKGLGMALLRENLARIDAEHMSAYLESSNPRNNHRYESAGFVAVSSFRAPGDGPAVTGMWRAAR